MKKIVVTLNLSKLPQFFFLFILSIILFSCDKGDDDPIPPFSTPTKVSVLEIPDVHPDESSVIKILSLKKFIKACKKDPQNPDIYNMYGLQRIEGYIVDVDSNDILLFAKQVKNWPSTSIFDFIESLRNVTDSSDVPPYCSLDPTVEGINALTKYFNEVDFDKFDINVAVQKYGKQTCVVGGVPVKSHFAYVMIGADYNMKKAGQGVVKLDSVKSVWDYWKESNYSEGLGMSRFWFNIDEKYPVYEELDNYMRIKELPVQISSMSQEIDGNGKIVDVPSKQQVYINFANDFTSHFKSSSEQDSFYAELDNIYHLQAITKALEYKNLLSNYETIFQYFKKSYPVNQTVNYPDELESVISSLRVTLQDESELLLIISGGVNLNPTVTKNKIQQSTSDFLNTNTINFFKQVNAQEPKPCIMINIKTKDYQVNNIMPLFDKQLKLRILKNSGYYIDNKNIA